MFFHHLAKIPGPKLWAATRLRFVVSLLSGNLVHDVREIHERYGEIVRLAPDEISFAKEEAWHDIFGIRTGHQPFSKNPIYFSPPPGQPHNIVTTANVDDHARMRRVLNYAFTPTALKSQEPIIESYVDLLISRLREKAISNQKDHSDSAVLNMVDWYNYVAFDIVSDLGFGEPLNCLKEGVLHPWVGMIFNFIKGMTLAASTRYYPWLEFILMRFLVPASLLKMAEDHYQLALDKIHRRMSLEQQRSDFMTPVFAQGILNIGEEGGGGKGMTLREIESTFSMLIIAGSETVATALSGITNYLIQTPFALAKLDREIRHAFTEESQITIAALKELVYLQAVIQEGLRLCNPVPAGLPRVVPQGGATVCGVYLPGGTNVSVHPWTINNSPSFFHRPEEFIPDRWLPLAAADDSTEGSDEIEWKRPAEHANDHLSAVHPFGLGPRACIGKGLALAELRLVLARLVWAFGLGVPEGQKGLDWRTLKTYIIVQKEPVWVRLRMR